MALLCSLNSKQWAQVHKEIQEINDLIGSKLEVWPESRVKELYHSKLFHHGIYDPACFTVHPFNLCLGLARVAEKAGVKIYEHTRAVQLVQGKY